MSVSGFCFGHVFRMCVSDACFGNLFRMPVSGFCFGHVFRMRVSGHCFGGGAFGITVAGLVRAAVSCLFPVCFGPVSEGHDDDGTTSWIN